MTDGPIVVDIALIPPPKPQNPQNPKTPWGHDK